MNRPNQLAHLESLLEARYGLAPSNDQRERLAHLARHRRQAPSEQGSEARSSWLNDVVESLVVGETYFFREPGQIDHCVRRALPQRAQQASFGHPLRILSAGCSSGEEPYSLAMALEAFGPEFVRRVSIVGVDVSATAIRKAREARYSAWSLRATPRAMRETCFHPRGAEFELDERFRSRVRFEERNLFDDDPELWAPAAFDFVFCRNVTIYFSERALRDLARRFATVLAPGGCLFLGHSETLRGISDDFDLVHDDDVFYYRRKASASRSSPPLSLPLASVPDVAALRLPVQAAEGRRSTADIGPIVSLIEAERFDEAMAALQAFGPGTDASWLKAIVWMAKGAFGEAEQACRAMLSSGRHESEAHYMLGLCAEEGRAYDAAERHYRDACSLDPHFAMPRLRLGLLLRRSGDGVRSRLELQRAQGLLESEERARISLFGGGFSRDVLIDLCRDRQGHGE